MTSQASSNKDGTLMMAKQERSMLYAEPNTKHSVVALFDAGNTDNTF